jgi:cytoskeletal protein CcmA (bactofilin family)
MWRKPNEAKPSSQASNTPAPALVKPQETPQAVSVQSSAVSATPVVVHAPAAPPTVAAPVVAPAAQVSVPANGGPSTISAGLKIRGEITGTSDLIIDGDTQGKIRLANGCVTVGPNGRVTADIDAREIVVNGTVQGNLKATESVRLGPNSHVEGSVLTPRIGIDDGARLRGNVEMTRPGETPAAAPPASKVPAAVRVAAASAREE